MVVGRGKKPGLRAGVKRTTEGGRTTEHYLVWCVQGSREGDNRHCRRPSLGKADAQFQRTGKRTLPKRTEPITPRNYASAVMTIPEGNIQALT